MRIKHNSHYIFLFLGLLVLLFVLIFGVRYFQSSYFFSDREIILDNTQDYNDGVAIENPFTNPLVENKESSQEIIPSTDISFSNELLAENISLLPS
jgi:hypothetical protein